MFSKEKNTPSGTKIFIVVYQLVFTFLTGFLYYFNIKCLINITTSLLLMRSGVVRGLFINSYVNR